MRIRAVHFRCRVRVAFSRAAFWMLGGVRLARWDLLPVPAVCALLAGGAS